MKKEPLITYAGDFNNDGRTDPVMTFIHPGSELSF